MITLYHSPRSRSTRILWLLEELGAPYEVRQVSIFRPMSGEGAPDPANPHPNKRVPAIVHDGELVAESVAIVLYLTDAFPAAGLGPAAGEVDRGTYLTWLAWYAAEMEPAMFAAMGGELGGNPMKQRNYDAVIARIQGALAKAPFLMGEAFTGADLLVSSAVNFARQAFPESALLDAYVERCKARPAMQRAIALDETAGAREAA
ncbi:MAG TPA: glutathione S-transferase family protein [Sphingomonas sp.]|nr:glutathione S-transferase family protein [Sphingomonas sp.]